MCTHSLTSRASPPRTETRTGRAAFGAPSRRKRRGGPSERGRASGNSTRREFSRTRTHISNKACERGESCRCKRQSRKRSARAIRRDGWEKRELGALKHELGVGERYAEGGEHCAHRRREAVGLLPVVRERLRRVALDLDGQASLLVKGDDVDAAGARGGVRLGFDHPAFVDEMGDDGALDVALPEPL